MLISVIMPVYNSAKYLDKSIQSIKNQTYDTWELIIVDDGSTDKSANIIEEYSGIDSRIKPIYQENTGPGAARNSALNKARGEYIVFVDSDDYVDSDYLEEINKCYEHTRCDVIFTNVVQETPGGAVIKKEAMSSFRSLDKETLIKVQMTGKMPWGGVRKAVKADMIKTYNVRYSNDIVGEEAVYSFKILYFAKKILFLDKFFYHYVNYPNSQSKKGDLDPWGPVCNKVEQYIKDIGEYEKYCFAINAFRITGFSVVISRIVKTNSNIFDKYRYIKKLINDNKIHINAGIDKACLDWRVKVIMLLMKKKLVGLLLLLSYANTIKNNQWD